MVYFSFGVNTCAMRCVHIVIAIKIYKKGGNHNDKSQNH